MTTKTQNNNLTTEQEKSIALLQHLQIDHFVCDNKVYEGDIISIENDYNDWLEEDESNADRTFEEYVADNCIEVEEYDDYSTVDGSRKEFLVLDENEADDRFEQSIENYVNDCVLSEIPKPYHRYFNLEEFTDDCKAVGRGHTIASYDGEENEEEVNGTTYYIYRIN